ncbi:NAD(P)-dependent oxidoreductase [Dongia soli]|uniref:NAD(P)-dependent oxidoreductase n=1 Tax=Dongia soli TaxID=600628 RepID=A0ABU5E9C4_9PROT|nr:NAD(P)-dependent oxidoreductase [Dongia soli]MDY0882615.1 NAD(P)-dependent oxidoreductase [Dongia soli]
MTDIAYIGLGIMGRGMVRNLLSAGHSVAIWNRTPRDLPPELAAATVAPNIRVAVQGKPVVFLCLTGPDAQLAILTGAEGVFAAADKGAIIADATTTDPHLTKELAGEAAKHGLRYLDTPVFGSKNEAWEGKLDFVCGGDKAAYDEIRPLLDAMAASVHYLGTTSNGAAAKLVGNLLVAAQLSSLGEALALARKSGLDPAALMGYLDVTDFSSPLIRGVGRATLGDNFDPSFYLKHMLKDARLIGAYARSIGVALPASSTTAELYQAAVNRGLGDLNASALHKLQFEMSGLD